MTYSIQHLFHINASKEEVFKAITTLNGLRNWWTISTEGNTGLNGEIQFNFGDYKGPKMQTTEQVENERLVWECIDSDHGWIQHQFFFELDENDGKTRIRFTQDGWQDQGDFYGACSFTWGRYLESLRQYCQTGKGEAFGSEGYRK